MQWRMELTFLGQQLLTAVHLASVSMEPKEECVWKIMTVPWGCLMGVMLLVNVRQYLYYNSPSDIAYQVVIVSFALAAIRCSVLSNVDNGSILYSDSKTSPHKFGIVATYQCDQGYVLNGGDATQTCVGDGTNSTGYWNGTTPNCSGIRNQ